MDLTAQAGLDKPHSRETAPADPDWTNRTAERQYSADPDWTNRTAERQHSADPGTAV